VAAGFEITGEGTMQDEIAQFAASIRAKRMLNIGSNRTLFSRPNYYQIPSGRLIIKISRSQRPKNPFWGVGAAQIDVLDLGGRPYFLVLLVSEKEGWVFSADEVQKFITSDKWRLAGDSNYKINMPLPNANAFLSPEQFLQKISSRP